MIKRKASDESENRNIKRKHDILENPTFNSSITSNLFDHHHEQLVDSCRLAIDQARHAISKKNHVEAIVNATSGLNDWIKTQMSLLDVRATAFGMAHDLKNGLCDAMHMIALDPTSSQGYLAAGNLLSMWCKTKLARDIYKQGYDTVRNNDEKRTLLIQRYHATNAQLNRSIDLIGQLPYDVLPIIFKNFETRELLELLDISQIWRDQLSVCSPLWFKAEICKPSPLPKAASAYQSTELTKIGYIHHQIVHLHLKFVSSGDFMQKMFHQIASKQQFTKLRTLLINSCTINDNTSLYSAIERKKESLKELIILYNIYRNERCLPMPFKSFLSVCENLERFYYAHPFRPSPGSMGHLSPERTSSLSNLTLLVHFLEEKDVVSILQFCPKLRHLILRSCPTQILRRIHHYCKELEYLTLNKESEDVDGDGHILPNNPNWKSTDGLRSLHVAIQDVDELVPILQTYSKSLELLSIRFKDMINGQHHNFERVIMMEASMMNKLKMFSAICGDTQEHAAMTNLLLQKMIPSNITHVYFRFCILDGQHGIGIMRTLVQLKNLAEFKLRDVDMIHKPSLIQLLRENSVIGAASERFLHAFQHLEQSNSYRWTGQA
ncbi:hypothetical protein BDA99DRAFT_506684 [Phascolomyces articulosus]|uniref:F-box domain-containing protein n=1 Tax=Phascolomyces articulosus TaxID=60185 RepID=A0AAD5KHJ6_9FUNG|nr:hypothetical protein BDA99DRAFT_506684 [Phascolomyces articulosus]